MRRLFGLIFVLAVMAPQMSFAFPLTSERPWAAAPTLAFTDNVFNFDAIVGLSNCSGSFVKFKNTPDDAPAMVLTNGHCTGGMFGGMPRPGEVFHRKPSRFNMSLLDRSGQRLMSLRADMIIYATMTDTDAAPLELNTTYRQIKQQTGVDPLVISDVRPSQGIQIEIPSGYWKRTYSCMIDGFVHRLEEAGWTMKDSIRYSERGCEVIGGTSGSPIVSVSSGEIVGINNTGNESGEMCTMNNPCEVDENGNKRVIRGRGYGQQTYTLTTCVNAQGRFDITVAGCVLPKPR